MNASYLQRLRRAFTLIELLVVISIIAVLASLLMPAMGRMRQSANVTKATNNLKSIATGISLYAGDNDNRLPLGAGPGYVQPFWCGGGNMNVTTSPDDPSNLGIARYIAPRSEKVSGYAASPTLQSPLLKQGEHHPLSDFGANRDLFPIAQTAKDTSSAISRASVPRPAQTIMVATALESREGQPLVGTWYIHTSEYAGGNNSAPRPADHGCGKVLAVFVDGHAEEIKTADLEAKRKQYLLPFWDADSEGH